MGIPKVLHHHPKRWILGPKLSFLRCPKEKYLEFKLNDN